MKTRMTAAGICLLAAVSLADLHADRAPSSPAQADKAVGRFAADLSVHRAFLNREGRPLGATVPPIRYRMERTRDGNHWKTVMRITSATQAPALTSGGKLQEIPAPVSRIEDDGDGSEPRIYARDGRLLRFPDKSTRKPLDLADFGRAAIQTPPVLPNTATRPVTGDEWLESMLPSAAGAAARRAMFERRYGAARGKVRGLDRFMTVAPGGTTEILVDAATAVPVEMNIVRDGQLESHTGYTYVAMEGGRYLRQRMQREQRGTGMKDGTRLSVDVTVSNVTIAPGGER